MDFKDDIARPSDFANELFVHNNIALFERYAQYRVKGHTPASALRMTFGEDYFDSGATARIYALEGNSAYQKIFQRLLNATKISDMWNPKQAVHELICLARDKFEKGSVRLGAIKELNVLCEITVVDETGKTKAGRNLADFYAAESEQQPARGEVPDVEPDHYPTTH